MKSTGLTTRLLHADRKAGVTHGSFHKPVHNSVAYNYPNAQALADVFQGKEAGYSYGRQNNPTTTALEAKIDMLEQGQGTVCFATGMAAIASSLLALLRDGDHLIASQFLFGNTNSLFNTLIQLGIEVSFVDATDAANVSAAKKANTKAVFVETIANPCTQICDLAAIGDYCEQEKLLYIVDNTMTTPYLFLPREVKAGLVINSLSKSIAGHASVLGGAVTSTGLYNWEDFGNIYDNYKKGDASKWGLLQIRKKGLRDMGATLQPEDASRIALGLETLALRVPRACDNALALARFFDAHSAVDKVYYPGLESHPEHGRASDWFGRHGAHYGSLLSIDLKPEVDTFAVLDRLQTVILSSHLGDNRTLSIPVAQTIYYEMGPERRASMGIGEGTVRLSIGIEDQQDLLADFEQALKLK